ncbi:MAG: hypothetical protein FD138_2352 [Planctomycetota bacterium]|nr:MAG: hypothetical protein FD138_2352 [Planctomycetota bacterium]
MHISAELLKQLSEFSTPVILCAFLGHLVVFVMLWMAYRHNLRAIAQTLDDFTRGLKHRSVLDRSLPLSDQIEAFLTDVKDALDIPAKAAERQELAIRMSILDEKRRYLHAMRFETIYNVWRSMIEAYPMAGILGTVLAIGAALQTDQTGSATVNAIVRNFGESIWSTFSALAAAVVLIFLNSWIEPAFARLSENREHVRDMVARAKRELTMSATSHGAS